MAAQSLQNALRLLESFSSAEDQSLPEHLKKNLWSYQNNLEFYGEKLAKLQGQSTDGKIRRSWTRLKTVLHEKDLQNLHSIAHDFNTIVSDFRQTEQL